VDGVAESVINGRLSVNESQLEATKYVLTIEPNPDSDPAPAATHVLAGDFADSAEAVLSVGDPAALGNDFTGAAGQFILAARWC
jgi:hypothetical protein